MVWGERSVSVRSASLYICFEAQSKLGQAELFFGSESLACRRHREALLKSIQLDANAAQPRLLLATILHQEGKRADAEGQWHAVLQIDPSSEAALDGLANSLMDNGDAQIAIRLLQPAQKDELLTLDLARPYGVAGQLDQAAST